jgi:hypothetical protein
MSKNLYKVIKKSDLDEIIQNNYYKPISMIIVRNSIEEKEQTEIKNTLITISKVLNYMMILYINLDNFIDNLNTFEKMTDYPTYVCIFKGNTIQTFNSHENFIPNITNIMEKIHNMYVTKISSLIEKDEKELMKNNDYNVNNKQKDKETNKETNKHSNKQTEKDTEKDTQKDTEKETEKDTEKENDSDNTSKNESDSESGSDSENEDDKEEEIRKKKERLKELQKMREERNKNKNNK